MLEKRSTDNSVSNKNMELKDYIAKIENYPKEGVVFRDISPLMADGNAYNYAATEIVQYARDKEIDMVVGPEARGFIIGCPVAFALGVGFAPVRKPGKLPREVIEATYEKEYAIPPIFSTSSIVAAIVPPVASKSSTIKTRCPGLMLSECIVSVSVPYSFS